MAGTSNASATHERLPAELGALFREHGRTVWRTLRSLGLTESDADDICQEVFVVAHEKLHTFEGRSSVRTWLCGIAVRLAARHRRRFSTQREIPTEILPEIESTHGPEDALSVNEARTLVDRALAKLDEDKRTVFVLYEIEELPMGDVAEAVGVPLQTAYSRLYAARKIVESYFAALRRSDRREGGTER